MTLSNPIFSNSGAASFLDARNDMAGLIVQDETGLTRPGVLWASQDQLVTGRNDLMVDVHDFNASLERHGALLIANRGVAQVSIAAAPAANSRIDVVYVMQRETQAPMSDAAPAGPVFGVVQGVAAAVPVVPTSLPEGALALATIRMPAGASTTNSSGVVISQTYPMTTCNGGVIPMRSATDLDAFAGVERQRARLADGTEYVRRNGVWVSQTHTVAWKPPYTDGRLWLTRVGSLCMLSGNVKFSQGVDANYAKAKETLPMGFRPVDVNTAIAIFGGDCTFILYADATGAVTMLGNPNSAYAGCTGAWRTLDPMPAT